MESDDEEYSSDDFRAPNRKPKYKQGKTAFRACQSTNDSTRVGTAGGGTSHCGSNQLPAAHTIGKGDIRGRDPNKESKEARLAFTNQCEQAVRERTITFTEPDSSLCVATPENYVIGIPYKYNSKVSDTGETWTLPKQNIEVETCTLTSNAH